MCVPLYSGVELFDLLATPSCGLAKSIQGGRTVATTRLFTKHATEPCLQKGKVAAGETVGTQCAIQAHR